ncbi:hydrolase [Streptomyces sp. NBC_01142]|uniref:HAD family acid phosphatase n=1 Tax=Streptomyces sp. NBC_01142 TaxID=2975865 RepID=UPI0022543D73|nr:HAD family acid phosphatase [Streptomyces sp. NBC_01142]MCX4820459.1 hydrolase [Streptomyces sp. NBC_01142]
MHVRKWRTRTAATFAALAFTMATPVASAADATASNRSAHTAVHAAQQSPAGTAQLLDVDYGTWQRDVAAVVAVARPYIEQRTSGASGEKQAIVLDIDNTSLETDFRNFWEYPTPAVKPVLDLARFADSRGVDVFFVTARPGIIYSLTQYNLRKVGYPVSGLYVRDLPDLFDEVSAYKTGKRAEIEAKGYTIIANIGNKPSDLVGGHAERTFKLPDYDGQLS